MNTIEELTLLLRPADAAKALAICPRTLWTLTNSGGLPCVRMGRSVRYDPADLAEWIERHKTNLLAPAKQITITSDRNQQGSKSNGEYLQAI